MKRLFSTSAILAIFIGAIIFQNISCNKNDTPLPSTTYSVLGLWTGSYTINGHPELGQQYFSFVIKPDGTMINDTKYTNQQHLSVGPWEMKGDSLLCTATCVYGIPQNVGIVEKHSALFNKTTGTLTGGTWKNIPPLTGSGTFTLTKVN